jgi:hypothetical protein
MAQRCSPNSPDASRRPQRRPPRRGRHCVTTTRRLRPPHHNAARDRPRRPSGPPRVSLSRAESGSRRRRWTPSSFIRQTSHPKYLEPARNQHARATGAGALSATGGTRTEAGPIAVIPESTPNRSSPTAFHVTNHSTSRIGPSHKSTCIPSSTTLPGGNPK